jgi:hypothetical protein
MKHKSRWHEVVYFTLALMLSSFAYGQGAGSTTWVEESDPRSVTEIAALYFGDLATSSDLLEEKGIRFAGFQRLVAKGTEAPDYAAFAASRGLNDLNHVVFDGKDTAEDAITRLSEGFWAFTRSRRATKDNGLEQLYLTSKLRLKVTLLASLTEGEVTSLGQARATGRAVLLIGYFAPHSSRGKKTEVFLVASAPHQIVRKPRTPSTSGRTSISKPRPPSSSAPSGRVGKPRRPGKMGECGDDLLANE